MSSKTNYRREQKKPRNQEVVDMLLHCKGEAHSDKRDKRDKRNREWKDEVRDHLNR